MNQKPTYEELMKKLRQAEQQLLIERNNEKALTQNSIINSFINNISDMAWAKDVDSRFILVNKAFCEAVGMNADSLIGNTCEACFTKEEAEKFRKDDIEVMKGGKKRVIQEMILDSQKNEIWLETTKSPMLDESGNIIGTVAVSRNITERKITEKEFSYKTALLKAQFQVSIDGILVINDDGKVILSNERMKEMWNVPQDIWESKADKILLQHTITLLKDPDEFLKKVTYLYFHNNETSRDEIELKDGRFFDRFSSPIIDSEKIDYGRIWFFRDITDRKQAELLIKRINLELEERVQQRTIELSNANTLLRRNMDELKQTEEALRKSEEKLYALLQNIQAAVVVHGADTKILTCNKLSQELLGLTEDQLLGKEAIDPLWKFFNEDGSEMPYELYPVNQVIFTRNELKDFIIGIYRPGKSDIVTVLVNAIPEFDHDGNLSQVIVTFMDITERERVKELLKKSEEKFRFLTENMTDIVWILDMELRTTYVSPSIEKLFGYTPEERKRQSIEEQVTPESLKHIMERFQEELLLDKEPGVDPDRYITLEVEYYHKDGSTIWVENIAQAMRDENFEIVQLYGVSRDITERKHAEAALQQSEMKYRLLAENVTDVICVVNLDRFIFNYASPSVESVLGYTPNEFMNLNVYDLLTPDSADRAMAILAQEVENNKYGKAKPQLLEIEVLRKDGCTVWVEISARFLRDNKQQVNSVLCVTRDVSKRKLMEDALQENERKLRNIIEHSNELFYLHDIEHNLTYASPASMEILGYTPDEMMRNWTELVTDNPINQTGIETTRRAIKTGEKQNFYLLELKRKDRTSVLLEIDESPIKDEKGIVVGIVGAARDVTMREKVEQALRVSEEKYRLIMASMKDAVYITSKERRIEYTNPRMIKKIGCDAIGEFCYKAIFENDTPCTWCTLDQVQHGKCVEVEFENPKDKRSYTVINTPVFNTDGTISKLGIIRDITDQRKTESMLRQSLKMDAIGTLAGGVAHEFNNILGIILGNAELAVYDVPEWNPAKNYLEEIRKASLRAKNVVRQILSFARKMPPVYKPLKIGDVVKEALKLIRVTIPASIEIHQRILCDSEMILSNPTEINQIIMNLCSNAIYAMEEGTDILEIHLEAVFLDNSSAAQYEDLTAGKYVKLTVKDTGKGIDPAIIDRIFDPYFTTKDIDKGLGMGLAVVFGIVKEHEGAIKVMSEIGKGTTVEVLFPVAEVQSEAKGGKSDHLPTGTECILFVDDEEALVELTKKLLERLGYKVEAKTNPAEALRLFQEESDKFDLVITDMAMPVMTGDRLLKEITKIKPNIPIILCTGHSDRIDGMKAKEMGVATYAMKPLDLASLAGIVRAVLDKAKEYNP